MVFEMRLKGVLCHRLAADDETSHALHRRLTLLAWLEALGAEFGDEIIGMKRFKAAIQSFTMCFSAPTTVLNAIMVEAYKKCVLRA